jgi:hypothetical protein
MCFIFGYYQYLMLGRAIAQAVSLWFPTAAVQVRVRVWSNGISGGKSGAEERLRRVIRFPLPIFTPPNHPSSRSPGAGIIDQKWSTCRVDPVWTPPSTMRICKRFTSCHTGCPRRKGQYSRRSSATLRKKFIYYVFTNVSYFERSCWLPTAAVRVHVRVWQVGFVVNKVTSGQVLS